MRKQHPTDCVIVSRHPAAVEFIARHLTEQCRAVNDHEADYQVEGDSVVSYYGQEGEKWEYRIPVLRRDAVAEDVRGKHVYGNLPLSLACLTTMVSAVEFEGTPPRGKEYSLADMIAAGAKVVRYVVRTSEADLQALTEEWERAERHFSLGSRLGQVSSEKLLAELSRRLKVKGGEA